jgi:hypothetical protein
MANNGNGSGVDYYELRRKHQEYKKKAGHRQEDDGATPPPEDAPYVRPAVPAEDAPYARPVHFAEPVRAKSVPAEDEPEDKHIAFAADEDAYPDDGEADDSSSNPFHSFILTFNKIRDRFAARRGAQDEEGLDDADDDYGDEEPREEKRAPFRFLKRHAEEIDEEEADEPEEPSGDERFSKAPARPAEVEKHATAIPAAPKKEAVAPVALDVPEDESVPEAEEISVSRPMDEDEYEGPGVEDEEDDAPRESGFKRFLNLFIVREDRIDEPAGEDESHFDEPEIDIVDERDYDDSLFTRPREHGASEEEQDPMGEQENNKDNLSDLMADGLEDGTLSRRERRLLRERQEALKQAAEHVPVKAAVDEPTREYKPVARPQATGTPEPAPESTPSLFERDEPPRKAAKRAEADEDVEEPKARKRGRRDDDYDDYDDEEPKSRKRGRRDDDDDYDDEEPKSRKRDRRDVDYDDYDDEEPKSRKRGRRDVDFDDYGDEEPKSRKRDRRDVDFDDYDDEPRRGHRYDDEDDYDDDYAPSFGHYVLGFFKVLIAVVLVLAVALFGLYFADQAVPGGVGAYGWLQEKLPVIDKILPSGEDSGTAEDAADTLDLNTTSPDDSATPAATDAGAVG